MIIPKGLAVHVSAEMRGTLEAYAGELRTMNRRINLISRDDEDAILSRHIPHCMALAMRGFPAGSVVCDWGTGGGLPLIPLAVLFPDAHFIGIDAVDKKIQAVRLMARRIGVENMSAHHNRAESTTVSFHYSVSRATAPLAVLWSWHCRNRIAMNAEISPEATWRPGLVCLKGGALDDEIAKLHYMDPTVRVERISITELFSDEYFLNKEIISVHSANYHG